MTDSLIRYSDGFAETNSGERQQVTVRFEAASGSYIVSGGGRRQTFTAAQALDDGTPGEVRFQAPNEAGASDFLTLTTAGYSPRERNDYVGLGYWQSNSDAGTAQAIRLHVFTYGYETAPAAVPLSGMAAIAPISSGC